MNIKVLHVVRGLPNSSGTSHIVKPLAEEQARQGADVSVWSCEMPNEVPVEIDSNLVRTRMFPISLPLYHPGVSWPFARAIWKNVVEYDFVHIHAVFNFPTLMTMAAATRRKVPFAVAPQGSFEPWALAWHGRRKAIYAKCLELPLMQRAAFLQALTLTEESQMRNLGLQGKVKILPNGLNLSYDAARCGDISQWITLESGAKTLLSLSRVDPKKGIDLLIKAFALTVRPGWHLIVAGTDYGTGYQKYLSSVARDAGIEHRVHFIGEVSGDRKYDLLTSVDLFALASHSEGMPMGCLEAMGIGLAIVVSPGCNLSEFAEAGAALEIENEPDKMASKLVEMMDSEHLRCKMGARARNFVSKKFSWTSIATDSLSMYKQSMAE